MRTPTALALATVCVCVAAPAQTYTSGSEGPAVQEIQKRLRFHGYPVAASGRYDATTVRAVKRFQRARSLPATGRVDSTTRAALQRPLQRGDQGRAIRSLQERLIDFGERLVASGIFDGDTESALQRFQRDAGLPDDGRVDSQTLDHLSRVRGPVERLNRLIGEAERVLAGNPQGYRADVLVVIDYGVHSSLRRFFVVDRESRRVQGYRVGHGTASDPTDTGYAQRFSNSQDLATSVGVFRTAEVFSHPRLGQALRLDGLSSSNTRARQRDYVIYRAPRTSRSGDALPRGYGGPALDPSDAAEVIERIQGGVLVYAPDPAATSVSGGEGSDSGPSAYDRRLASDREAARRSGELDVDPRGGRVNYRGFTVSSPEVRAVLQRIANATGRTVRVTSGDRDHVPSGGSRTSLHLAHRAADFTVMGLSLEDAFQVLRDREGEILTDGGYEVIWHQANTNTGGPHLHVGFRGARRDTQFKTETRGVYTRHN